MPTHNIYFPFVEFFPHVYSLSCQYFGKEVVREGRQTSSSGIHLSDFIAPRKFLFVVIYFFHISRLPEESFTVDNLWDKSLKYDKGKMR